MADLRESLSGSASTVDNPVKCRPDGVKSCTFTASLLGDTVSCALIDYSNRTFVTVSCSGGIGNLYLVQRDSPQRGPLLPPTSAVYDVRCLLGAENPETLIAVRALAELLDINKQLLLSFTIPGLPPRSQLQALADIVKEKLDTN